MMELCTNIRILLNAKSQIGKSGKNRADWEKSINGRRSTLGCSTIEEDKEDEEIECQWSTNYRCTNERHKEVFSRPP
jgi:hypothetical protein